MSETSTGERQRRYLYLREKQSHAGAVANDWNAYWQTSVGDVRPGVVTIRGYPVQEVIRELSFVESVYLVLRGERPTKHEANVLDAVLRSTLEHGFVAPSTVAGRYVASSTPEAPSAAIAAAALAHGSVSGSPQKAAEMVLDLAAVSEEARQKAIERMVQVAIDERLVVPGIGHPIHKDLEPRAVTLLAILAELGAEGPHLRCIKAIHAEFIRASGKRLPLNVDGVFASALLDIGFLPLHMAGLAILSFLPGLIAHTVEEISQGVPLRYISSELGGRYVGKPTRHLSSNLD